MELSSSYSRMANFAGQWQSERVRQPGLDGPMTTFEYVYYTVVLANYM